MAAPSPAGPAGFRSPVAGESGAAALFEQVSIGFSATGLPKLDTFSNTDPFLVLEERQADGTWIEVDRTEHVMDTQEPEFTKLILMDYHFELVQHCRVTIYDRDHARASLSGHDVCGVAEFKLATLMCAQSQQLRLPLTGGTRASHRDGVVILRAEPVANTRDVLHVTFAAASKLAKKDGFFGKSDPYVTANRIREDGSWMRVWQSEVVDNNLMPRWRPATIPLQQLANGDIDRPLRFEVYDYDSNSSHDYMGSFETSVRGLLDASAPFDVIEEEKKQRKKSYRNSGTIVVQNVQLEHRPVLGDYLRAGLQVNMQVAIDFTASNGPPSTPQSLHYVDPTGSLNQYEAAISSVGTILQDYDHDNLFPVYGFGARLGPGQPVSHMFSVLPEGYEVQGVNGILEAYRMALQRVTLMGPTLLTPLITAAAQRAARTGSGVYHVLLVIADGVVNDMQAIKDALVGAADLPLSIIIVGVGSADFSDMNELDGDEERITSSSGVQASRDIVQFVAMRDFEGQGSFSRLAKEVLAEVPDQILKHMELRGISPGDLPPPAAPPSGASPSAPPPSY